MRGDGSISEKGYLRVFVFDPKKHKKRLRMAHDVIWEQHHGAIPSGYDVHYKDEDKLNNRISNLELVKHAEHKRIHVGFVQKRGQWVRRCADCGEETKYLAMRKRRCRLCYNAHMREYRRANGISTMRPKGGGNSIYINHGPGWQSKRNRGNS